MTDPKMLCQVLEQLAEIFEDQKTISPIHIYFSVRTHLSAKKEYEQPTVRFTPSYLLRRISDEIKIAEGF